MKKGLVILIILVLMGSFAYAEIKKSNVEARLLSLIAQAKSRCLNTAIDLGQIKSKAQAIVTTYNTSVDTDDKTKLQGLNTVINTAKDSLDSVITYIETNFDSVE